MPAWQLEICISGLATRIAPELCPSTSPPHIRGRRECRTPDAPDSQISERLPGPVLSLLDGVPILRPVLPDPGVPFQLVHHDDVATAIRAGVLGRCRPGFYNLAGSGQLTVAELASELGWYSIPVPELALDVVAEMISRLGFLPAQAQWISAFREP